MASPHITDHLTSRRRPALALLLYCLAHLLTSSFEAAPVSSESWPSCLTGANLQQTAPSDPQQQTQLSKIDIPAVSLGCTLNLGTQSDADTSAANGQVPRSLVLPNGAIIAGTYNGSLGRPPAVLLSKTSASKAEDVVLVVPEGGFLLLQDLLLVNMSLIDPQQGNPNLALLPTNFELPATASLKMRDVMLLVTQQQLQQYISFMLGVPEAVIFTDNVSFLHIRNYTNPPFGVVEARGVTLLAPQGAKIDNVPLGILQSTTSGGPAAAVAAAKGDAAGVVTVTDTYVMAATNSTMIKLMTQLAGQEATEQPLFVNLATNMTLAPKAWGSAWPAGGMQLKRPVIWAGSSWRPTSIDFGMEVGQIVLTAEYSNLTLTNLVLENLAFGDEESAADAEGNSILLSNQLWAFKYRRSTPRLVLYDVVLVLPEQRQIDGVIYWVNAFNSDLPFWRTQTTFLRDTLKYTVIQYTFGKVPGEYIIIKALKKDQLMHNLTYTTTPAAAPKLALPFNPSIHQDLVEGQADPVVGTVQSIEGLAVTIWNQRRSACSRPHVLIPSPDPESGEDWVSLAPTTLDLSSLLSDDMSATGSARRRLQAHPNGSAHNTTLLQPFPAGRGNNSSNRDGPSRADEELTPEWPPPGGDVVRCPLTIRGPSPQDPTLINVGFADNLFRVTRFEDNSVSSGGQSGLVAAAAAAAAQAPQGLLSLNHLRFVGLPQGGAAATADTSVSRAAAPASGMAGSSGSSSSGADAGAAWGSGWVSNLPAEAWTHLLWFIERRFSLDSASLVRLTDVTLLLPSPEARQLAEAANSALQAAGGDSATAVLSMLYPTKDGPLPVSYRSISFNGASAPAAANRTAVAPGHRRLLQQQSPSAAAAAAAASALSGRDGNIRLCVDTILGLGLSGKNICFVEMLSSAAEPPGYVWVGTAAGSGANTAWPAWKIAVLLLGILLPLLAAAAVAFVVVRRRRHAQQRKQQQLPKTAISDAKVVLGMDSLGDHSSSSRAAVASSAAAAAAGVEQSHGSSKSYHSGGVTQLLQNCCPGSSRDATDAAATNASSSSSHLLLHAGQTAAAGAAAAAAAAAVPADESTAGDSSSVMNLGLSSQQEALLADAAAAADADQIYKDHGSSLIVNLGEQLGQIAAMHKRTLWQQDDESLATADPQLFNSLGATLGEGETAADMRIHALERHQQQLHQQRGLLVISGNQQESTLQRLTAAISEVSAELQLRRLGAVSSGNTGLSLSPAQSGASAAAAAAGNRGSGSRKPSRSDSGGSGGEGHSRRQQQQQVTRLSTSIEEEGFKAAGSKDAAVVAVSAVERVDSPSLSALIEQPQPAAVTKPRRAPVASSSQLSNRSSGTAQRSTAAVSNNAQLQLHEVIGSGTFGVVYRATWRGIPAAVKVMQLSGGVIGCGGLERGMTDKQRSRREHMAVMETALGSSLSHPNIVQVYTYHIRTLHGIRVGDDARQQQQQDIVSNSRSGSSSDNVDNSGQGRKGSSSGSSAAAIVGYELQLVMEYCALGSLREALDTGLLEDRLTGRPHYLTVLTLALGVSRAMHHLHSEGVLHGDLKCGNVLLKMDIVGADSAAAAAGGVGGIHGLGRHCREQLTAKVADFGLATRLNDTDTHVSGVHRGTLNHMSPELLVHGHASRASDVYAMGILLWEMATGGKAFSDIPKAMLGAAVVRDKARPAWPDDHSTQQAMALAAAAATAAAAGSSAFAPDLLPPLGYRELVEACWAHDAKDRPAFSDVSATLEALLHQEQQRLASLAQLAEATASAQAAAATASGYAARRSQEFAAAAARHSPAAAVAAAVEIQAGDPDVPDVVANDVVANAPGPVTSSLSAAAAAPRPSSSAATIAAAMDKNRRASVMAAIRDVLSRKEQYTPAATPPTPDAAAAAAMTATAASAPVGLTTPSATYQSANSSVMPRDDGAQTQTQQAAAASGAELLPSATAAAAAAAAGSAARKPSEGAASRLSPFQTLKDQSWE